MRSDRGSDDTREERPLRVLIACDHLAYDGNLHGSGRFLVELLDVLRERGVHARACVLRDPGGLAHRLSCTGVPLIALGHGRFSPLAIVSLARRARAERADVLHVWDFGAATWGRIAGLIVRIPVVVHVHSHHSAQQRRGFPAYVRLAYRALAFATARAVVISASVRSFAMRAMGFAEPQLTTVGNPAPRDAARAVPPADVDRLRSEYGFGPGEPVIGTVTRLYPVKGIDVLIDGFARVLPVVPSARLLIVGEGPLRVELQARARTLGIDARVVFAGHRADVAAHYRLFAVTAMPSLEEGMPMAAIESITAGTPLVASREGGLVEVVSDGRSGLLVPVGDARALASALQQVLLDPVLAERLREGCRQESPRFARETFTEAMLEVYRSAVALGPAPSRRGSNHARWQVAAGPRPR